MSPSRRGVTPGVRAVRLWAPPTPRGSGSHAPRTSPLQAVGGKGVRSEDAGMPPQPPPPGPPKPVPCAAVRGRRDAPGPRRLASSSYPERALRRRASALLLRAKDVTQVRRRRRAACEENASIKRPQGLQAESRLWPLVNSHSGGGPRWVRPGLEFFY